MKKLIIFAIAAIIIPVMAATNRVQGVSFNTSNLVFSPPEVQTWNTNLQGRVTLLETNSLTSAAASLQFLQFVSATTNDLGYVTNLVIKSYGGVTNSLNFYIAP